MKKYIALVSLSISFFAAVAFMAAPSFAFAQGTPPAPNTPTAGVTSFALQNPLKGTTTLQGFFSEILDSVVVLLTPVVVIMLLYSGLLFILARGNEEKLRSAKSALLYTLIGAVIVIGAKGFAAAISSTITQF